MAGRSRAPAHVLHLRDPPPHFLGRDPPRLSPAGPVAGDPHLRRHPGAGVASPLLPPAALLAALEDRLEAQHREIQGLLLDNQRLAATHVALKQELAAARHELRLAAAATGEDRAGREAEVRGAYERAVAAEAEARGVDGIRAELARVRAEARELGEERDELVERLRGLREELTRTRAEAGQATAIRAEVEAMHREIQKGRAAVEYEKQARANNLEQSQVMEQNMISMAREVEKLRAELANAEKRARAAAAAAAAANPGYAGTYGNTEVAYGGSAYAAGYSMHQAQSTDADGGSQYGSGAVSRGPYDIQQTYAYR